MKYTVRFAPLVVMALAISAAFLIASDTHSTLPNGLTVHEWGTFTSVAGEDGSALEWDTLGCKNDLPKFVNDYGFRNFKSTLSGTVRMETPVMYFYSSSELDAHVKVSFPQGLITEWYPQADYQVYQKSGADGSMHKLTANLNVIDMSTSMSSLTGAIEWSNIKVQPGTTPTLPVESGANRYYAARATDSAPIAVGGEHEKFLFYRGVGRFPVPLSARASDDGKVAVENRGQDPVPGVMLFENRGGHMGYRLAGAVKDPVTLDAPTLDASFSQLRQDLEATLIAQGLFPKEAQAMVATWRDSWFEEGSRLIYIVPAATVDSILPMEVQPLPAQSVRVFVGRIELLTAETERTVESAVAKSDWKAVDRYSRFLSPILQRIYSGHPMRGNEIEMRFRDYQWNDSAGSCHQQ
jgi:hypothetical protein